MKDRIQFPDEKIGVGKRIRSLILERLRANADAGIVPRWQEALAIMSLGENIHLGIVEVDNEIACASLFFECYGIVQAHLGGTKTKYLHQSPFNFLLHYVRLWAKERGNEFLHIGGGVGGSTTDSLYTFKSGFSRQKHDFLTLKLITNEEKYYHLVNLRAKVLNTQAEALLSSDFFPVYRSYS